MTDKRVSKLPTWAQHEIFRLESDLEFAQAQIEQLSSPANTRICWTILMNDEKGIPDNAIIRFEIRGGTIDMRLSDYEDGITVHSKGSEQIMIAPKAANTMVVKFVKE